MSQSRLRREAVARGEPDPGPDRAHSRTVRVVERDGKKYVRLYDKEQEIEGKGVRHGDRVVLHMVKKS